MTSEHNPDQRRRTKTDAQPGPGPRLQAARIKAGRDIAELAAQLRLRKQVVEDLENNNYSSLPPPVFVQGYYRSLAEILDLPQDEIIQAYFQAIKQSQSEPTPVPQAEPSPDPVTPNKRPGFFGRLGGLGQQEAGQHPLDTKTETQDLSKPRVAPKAKLLFSPKSEAIAELGAMPETRTRPKVEPRTEPILDAEPSAQPTRDSDEEPPQDSKPNQRHTADPRQEPRMASRTEPRARRVEPEYRAQDQDVADTEPRSFQPRRPERRISVSLPRLSLPQWRPKNLGLWLRRTAMLGVALAAIGLGIWGLSLIPAKSIWNDIEHKWSALTTSSDPQAQQPSSLPTQAVAPEPIPTQPSADTQLLEPPELTSSLTERDTTSLTPSLDTEAEPAPKSQQGHHKILVELKGVSWVEIEDATKEYRLVGELQKGSIHELKGTPPYRMLFGRGNLVKVTIDGKNYDFSKHQQGSVARFTLAP